MKKLLAILLCMVLFVVPTTITASAQVDSGLRNVAGDEPYLVDVGVGYYAYSTYSVTVPVYVMTYQQGQIYADMSNFDTNYALSCYVANADNNSRITLYADNYNTTGNAVSVLVSNIDSGAISGETKLLHKFRSTMGSEDPMEICYFELGAPNSLNGDLIVTAGNYTGTLSLRFVCEVA